MSRITAFFARKSVAMFTAVLIAVAGVTGGAALAEPAFAGDDPTTLTFHAPPPGTGSVTVTLPSETEIAYGASASYSVVVTCPTPVQTGSLFFGLSSPRQLVSVSPDANVAGNWHFDTVTNLYTYTGNAQMPMNTSSAAVRINVNGDAVCFGADGVTQPLDTLTTDPATRPADDAPWAHTTLTAGYINRQFSNFYTNQSVSGPATDSYTYSLGSPLPSGMTLSSNGGFSGIPTVSGDFLVQVIATDDRGHEWTHGVSGSILPAQLWDQPTVGTLTNGRYYAQGIAGPAYDSNYVSYVITAGVLPGGISLEDNGAFIGTPEAAVGDYDVTVKATDALGYQYSLPVTLTVVDGIPANAPWVNKTIPNIQYGHAISLQLAGPAGNGAYEYSYSGYTPDDLNFYGDGSITGTTTSAPGTYTVDVTATDDWNDQWTTAITYTILPEAPWGTLTIPHGQVGSPYSVSFVAPNYGSTWTYSYEYLDFGPIPAPSWLVTNSDGLISGIPDSESGMYLQVTATDPENNSFSAVFPFIVDPFVPVWSSTVIAPQYPGIPSSASVVASGDHVTYSVASGSLPAGLLLNADGTISGNPVAVGPYDVTIRAEQDGETSDQEFTGTVLSPSATLTLNFTVGSSNLTLDASAAGLAPGSDWSLVLHSTPATIGSGVAAGDGTIFKTVTIPAGTPAGAHELILSGVSPSGAPITARAWFTLGKNGTILAISLTGPTPSLASLAATGAPDVDGAILVGLFGLIVGAGILIFRRRRA